MNERDDGFEARLRQALDRRAEALDTETRAALARIRRRAGEAASRPSPHPLRRPLLAAAVLLLGVALLLLQRPTSPPAHLVLDEEPGLMEDWPLLAGTEDLQFYEDLDLVWWLDTQAAPRAPVDGADAPAPRPADDGGGTGRGRG